MQMQSIRNKNKRLSGIIPVIILVLVINFSHNAQAQTIVVRSTPVGMFIYLGENIPVHSSYRLERTDSPTDPYKQIATISIKADQKELLKQLKKYTSKTMKW